jgi:hypothetical protein
VNASAAFKIRSATARKNPLLSEETLAQEVQCVRLISGGACGSREQNLDGNLINGRHRSYNLRCNF